MYVIANNPPSTNVDKIVGMMIRLSRENRPHSPCATPNTKAEANICQSTLILLLLSQSISRARKNSSSNMPLIRAANIPINFNYDSFHRLFRTIGTTRIVYMTYPKVMPLASIQARGIRNIVSLIPNSSDQKSGLWSIMETRGTVIIADILKSNQPARLLTSIWLDCFSMVPPKSYYLLK